jgi:hypothetical protein
VRARARVPGMTGPIQSLDPPASRSCVQCACACVRRAALAGRRGVVHLSFHRRAATRHLRRHGTSARRGNSYRSSPRGAYARPYRTYAVTVAPAASIVCLERRARSQRMQREAAWRARRRRARGQARLGGVGWRARAVAGRPRAGNDACGRGVPGCPLADDDARRGPSRS